LGRLQTALTARVADTLGLARRAGQAVSGFTKAREWVTGGRAALVVQARDGSAEERARFLGGAAGRLSSVTPLDAARLGAIFGRDHVVHVAVAPGRLADRLALESGRLAGLESPAGDAAIAAGPRRGEIAAARRGAQREARDETSPPGAAGRNDPPARPDGTPPAQPDGTQGAGG
jgi:hypothetical protein